MFARSQGAAARAPHRASRKCGRIGLAGILLIAAALAGCKHTTDQKAAAAVERLNGKVKFAGQAADRAVVEVDLSRTSATDSDLERLASLAQLQTLNLSGTATTDRGLKVLRNIPSLKKLNLNLTKISDSGLAYLVDLPALEELYLIETPLTDASVEYLQRMTHLKQLILLRTRLTPAAVSTLRRQLPTAAIQIESGQGARP